MFKAIGRFFSRTPMTPEKAAERQLQESRMHLFAAERAVQDAVAQANFYRQRVSFYEQIQAHGVENWSDNRSQEVVLGRMPDLARGANQDLVVVPIPAGAKEIDTTKPVHPNHDSAVRAHRARQDSMIPPSGTDFSLAG